MRTKPGMHLQGIYWLHFQAPPLQNACIEVVPGTFSSVSSIKGGKGIERP